MEASLISLIASMHGPALDDNSTDGILAKGLLHDLLDTAISMYTAAS